MKRVFTGPVDDINHKARWFLYTDHPSETSGVAYYCVYDHAGAYEGHSTQMTDVAGLVERIAKAGYSESLGAVRADQLVKGDRFHRDGNVWQVRVTEPLVNGRVVVHVLGSSHVYDVTAEETFGIREFGGFSDD